MQSIPYHPSLALGSILDTSLTAKLTKILQAAAPADSAQEKLNALILAKRSLDMLRFEMAGMNIPLDKIESAVESLNQRIAQAAQDYASATLTSVDAVLAAKTELVNGSVVASVDSPIDFASSSLIPAALGADSLKLDAQYFSNDEPQKVMAALRDAVAGMTAVLGNDRSSAITTTSTTLAADQYLHHEVEGTLVFAASCTHRYVCRFAPLVLDPDKAARAWNFLYPDDPIDLTGDGKTEPSADRDGKTDEHALNIISGAAFGSSFVGMAHILQQEASAVAEDLEALVKKLQPALDLAAEVEEKTGEERAASPVLATAKAMLERSKRDSHCSFVCMGVIPNIASSLDVPASSARAKLESSADRSTSQMLDLGSLMAAFENYLAQVRGGLLPRSDAQAKPEAIGVPLTYFFTRITKQEVQSCWNAKYKPQATGSRSRKPNK